ncbi:DNA-binding transcriptional regulator, LacI/PurR family [Amycolatopsis sacchari]|uniref:DNA-binding transcriptional regulator, LacI/PurR family n=1 Tax=Amycolatopsis sacchari TaxID=115433 RepID=A0A1I3JY23_9PSEU|nr:LacI family DNA-binding transcriptional regulator [Amycolatopsis sacchari]SFI65167.1 DNA-binding transcriptional regulator, LacI/PurR family [Amycolatopsis sacchari]
MADDFPRRRPTMADVAARVGVSRALVSLVFRGEPGAGEETRARVFAAARELGYRPDSAARLLARSRSRVLGVMLTVRNLFHADLVEAIHPEAERRGYEILLSAALPECGERRAVEALLSHRCEGLILLGGELDADYVRELGERIPAVVVGRRFPGARVDAVHVAETKGVRQIVDHLVGLGHRSIAHIDGGNGAGAAERRRGYLAAMRRHGLAAEIRVLPGDHTEDSGARAARALLADRAHLPTAVFAGNDRCALGFLDAVWRAGLEVPRDVSVVGYDDSHLARLSHIDLTSVRQDTPRQGRLAVQAVVARLEDPDAQPRELVLQPQLVVRGTTGPPPVAAIAR